MSADRTRPEDYRSTQHEPADFDAFWNATLSEARAIDVDVTLSPANTALVTLDVYDVSFRGFAGDRIRAWLRLPRERSGPLPGVVQFFGYGNGRGHALRDLRWASAGYAHLVVDARGQGHGDTDDPQATGGPSAGEFLTRGIRSREEYYYRRVFTDAVRAVDAMRSIGLVDGDRIVALGASQGGGIALAMTGLVPELRAAVIQAPFLCELNRAPQLTSEYPYSVLTEHFAARRGDVDRSLETLAYFDGVNFARRSQAPALFSIGLADLIAPPETGYAAYHAYAGPKQLVAWPYNGHEAGGEVDEEHGLAFVAHVLDGGEHPRTHHNNRTREHPAETTGASMRRRKLGGRSRPHQ